MYNASKPSSNELPSSAKLLRSTVLAVIGAGIILVMVVLPAEYGIDPTGVGRVLGLTEVGEIKVQLATEAEADRRLRADVERMGSVQAPIEPPVPSAETSQGVVADDAVSLDPKRKNDEITIELAPGEGAEVKLVMNAGDQADFDWTANGGLLNYDQHGHGNGRSISYEKGRGVAKDEGVIEAAFDGNHGWFWRNRTATLVKLTLRTSGTYLEFKRML